MKKQLLMSLQCTIAVIVFSPSSTAAQDSEHYYLGTKVGWSHFQNACTSDYEECNNHAIGYGLFAGYQIMPWLGLEAALGKYDDVDARYSNSEVEASMWDGELAAKLSYEVTKNHNLYLSLGGSYQHINKKINASAISGNSWSPMVAVGLGYNLSKSWSLSGEYQFIDGIGDNDVEKADLHFASIKLTYHFGQSDSAKNFTKPVVVKKQRQQPEAITPPMISVELNADLMFAFDSANLNPTEELRALAQDLRTYQHGQIMILGHTDSQGAEAYNQRLSGRRAQSVAAYLEREGISRSRFLVIAEGERKPIASNKTQDGRAKNRRVNVKYSAVNKKVI